MLPPVAIDAVKSIFQVQLGQRLEAKLVVKSKSVIVKHKRHKTNNEGTITFVNIPLYLLEEPCH